PLAPRTPPDPWNPQAAPAPQYSYNGSALLRWLDRTNDRENHLNVIGSRDCTSRASTRAASLHMAAFWEWLSTQPTPDPTAMRLGMGGADGIGQFNHPGDKGGLNWDDYAFDAAAAKAMSTIEIRGSQGLSAGSLSRSDAGWYWFALSQGWTVSPVM